MSDAHRRNKHRITEYAKLKGIHKDHCVQPLPGRGQHHPQEPYRVPESIVQMLPELSQVWCCDHCPGELFLCPNTLWVKNLFLISKLNLPWHNFRPPVLCRSLLSSINIGNKSNNISLWEILSNKQIRAVQGMLYKQWWHQRAHRSWDKVGKNSTGKSQCSFSCSAFIARHTIVLVKLSLFHAFLCFRSFRKIF